jgi:hypothetical protein
MSLQVRGSSIDPIEFDCSGHALTVVQLPLSKKGEHDVVKVVWKGTFRERWQDGDVHVIAPRQR